MALRLFLDILRIDQTCTCLVTTLPPAGGMTKPRPITAADQPASPADTREASWSPDPPPPRHSVACLSTCIVCPFVAFGGDSALAYFSRQRSTLGCSARITAERDIRIHMGGPAFCRPLFLSYGMSAYTLAECAAARLKRGGPLAIHTRGRIRNLHWGAPRGARLSRLLPYPSSCPLMTCVRPNA
jgi:hypothetical protein